VFALALFLPLADLGNGKRFLRYAIVMIHPFEDIQYIEQQQGRFDLVVQLA